MQVVEQSETRLVLREQPWLVVGVGALLAGAGAYVALFGGEPAFGGLFVAVGLAAILGWGRAVTCTFDRGSGFFTREGGGWIGARELRVRLDEIVGVDVVQGASRGRTYRVELTTRPRDRVPLTPTFGSGRPDKERLAERVRGFLGLAAQEEIPIPGFRDLLGLIMDPSDARGAELQQRLAGALAANARPDEARAKLRAARELLVGAGRIEEARKIDEMIEGLEEGNAGSRSG